MATTPRPAYTKVMTPEGVLVWPKLDSPDEYKGKKSYSAKIRLSPDDSQVLIASIEKALAAHWPVAKAELEQKLADAKTGPEKAKAKLAIAEMKEADKSYRPAYDDEGNETGEYEFNFKMPDHFIGRDKKPVYIRPDVFDASTPPKKLTPVPEIWGGTVAVVAGELRPFSMPIGVGISLRLQAVQIIKLAGKGGNRDGASYGFGGQEGGYQGDDAPEGGPFNGGPPAGHPAGEDGGTDEF